MFIPLKNYKKVPIKFEEVATVFQVPSAGFWYKH